MDDDNKKGVRYEQKDTKVVNPLVIITGVGLIAAVIYKMVKSEDLTNNRHKPPPPFNNGGDKKIIKIDDSPEVNSHGQETHDKKDKKEFLSTNAGRMDGAKISSDIVASLPSLSLGKNRNFDNYGRQICLSCSGKHGNKAPKVVYRTKEEADADVERLRKRKDRKLESYCDCPNGYWHLRTERPSKKHSVH